MGVESKEEVFTAKAQRSPRDAKREERLEIEEEEILNVQF